MFLLTHGELVSYQEAHNSFPFVPIIGARHYIVSFLMHRREINLHENFNATLILMSAAVIPFVYVRRVPYACSTPRIYPTRPNKLSLRGVALPSRLRVSTNRPYLSRFQSAIHKVKLFRHNIAHFFGSRASESSSAVCFTGSRSFTLERS